MRLIYLLIIAILFTLSACKNASDSTNHLKDWIVENEGSDIFVETTNNILEIIAPQGLVLWYNKKLTGEYTISYRICMVAEGYIFDRLKDMNCFWAANDPKSPKNFFERSKWRIAGVDSYNSLTLFYAAYGNNENTTTQFYHYDGESSHEQPIKEYTSSEYLLKPDRWYHVEIEVTKEFTSYKIDGKPIFTYPLQPKEGDGYFGLQLSGNHIQLMDFEIGN